MLARGTEPRGSAVTPVDGQSFACLPVLSTCNGFYHTVDFEGFVASIFGWYRDPIFLHIKTLKLIMGCTLTFDEGVVHFVALRKPQTRNLGACRQEAVLHRAGAPREHRGANCLLGSLWDVHRPA